MSKELNQVLKRAYDLFKDESEPPVPIPEIKEYLALEGIEVNPREQDKKRVDLNE